MVKRIGLWFGTELMIPGLAWTSRHASLRFLLFLSCFSKLMCICDMIMYVLGNYSNFRKTELCFNWTLLNDITKNGSMLQSVINS